VVRLQAFSALESQKCLGVHCDKSNTRLLLKLFSYSEAIHFGDRNFR